MLQLQTPLSEIAWITPQRARLFDRFGLRNVEDLLTHFPRRHEDRRKFDRFPTQESDTPVCVCGTVANTAVKRFGGRSKMFEVTLEEDEAHALSPTLNCRWFNAHYVQKMIAIGQRLVVFGKPKKRGKQIVIDHPEFEIVENDDDASIHLKRIAPVYRATAGISQRLIRSVIFRVLKECDDAIFKNRLPAELDDSLMANAMRAIHFPADWEALETARQHLVVSEFFAMQLCIAAKRAEHSAQSGAAHALAPANSELMEKFQAALPFPLTNAQRRTISEIREDLAAQRPMNRLLHGDVGSGKTVVALSAMLLCVESGFQAALMAPTQILAEQHYMNFKRWLAPLGISVALRTGSRKEETTMPLFDVNGNLQSAADENATNQKSIKLETSGNASQQTPGSTRVSRVVSGVSPETSKSTAKGAIYSKRNLPHFECPWSKYAITFSTKNRKPLSPKARTITLNAIRHFHEQRYELYAACVMPDHVHLLIEPQIKETDANGDPIFFSLSEILHSLKSFAAHEINHSKHANGEVWEKESFDRLIRSERDFQEKYCYILDNPWRSNLANDDQDYEWIWPLESFRRDAEKHTRDAYAPRSLPPHLPKIIVGTHALLYDETLFSNLGLVVIDEQHKFGVAQRARLMEKAVAPDVLVMTATPIPRTLTMTVFGDLDVSTLDEMPANRGKIITGVRDQSKLPDAVKFIREHLEKGRQAYIVYPLIDGSEKLEAKAAAQEFEKWKTLLAPLPCELLHGRVDANEKQAIMQRFRSGKTKALVATSVIEVGIDVPNANIMLIENAGRFGLAQLHQLRGRIGRGEHKSYCVLISELANDEAREKLLTLERTANGFEVAEADLRLRGTGDILGTAQSGLAPLKIGDLLKDGKLMQRARKAAMQIFADDPHLAQPENQKYRQLLETVQKRIYSQVS